ncbi:MAG: 30S ribosomal protein S16 [bacterium]|nr:MAG: 30S ribosomal protein S16 [bacterium]
MAVVIRLSRHGRKKKPFYRIVAADRRFSRDGRFLEILGTHDPIKEVTDVKKRAAEKWIRRGACLSPTVKQLFVKHGVSISAAGE